MRTLLIVALLASTATAKERIAGYVRVNGQSYAVVETTVTKPGRVNNDYFTRARVGYTQSQYGKAGTMTVKPKTITRRVYVPVR